jgi:hypothetical protein
VRTLFLPARYSEDSIRLWQAARELGWKVERLPSWRVPEGAVPTDVAVYGEPLFAASVAEQLELALLEPPFDWLAGLPDEFLLRRVEALRLGDLARVAFPAFLKPADDKCFPARVYTSPDGPGLDLLPEATPILVSEPVTFDLEVRTFVVSRELATFSIYARSGELAQAADGSWPLSPSESAAALSCLEALLADDRVRLPPAIVVDIGRVPGRGWAVVEANPAFSSGLYGCDPKDALRTIASASKPLSSASGDDMAWIVLRPEPSG